MTSPLPPSSDPAPLLVASVDELRVLATLAGTELPPVLDGDPGAAGRTLADVVAVRSLLARGWLEVGPDGTAATAPHVAAALGALGDPTAVLDAVVEVEVRSDDELVRRALVLGPGGARSLAESWIGVWAVTDLAPGAVAPLDELVSAAPTVGPEGHGDERDRPRRELDRDAELLAGGREVVLRVARRHDDDRFEAEELHWVVGPGGRWLVEPLEGDLDADGSDDVAVPVGGEELDDLVLGLLAAAAEVLGHGVAA